MVGQQVMALLSALAVTASAQQDYSDQNRRIGGYDEDISIYDYEYENSLPPVPRDEVVVPLPPPPPPPRRRVVQPPRNNQFQQNGGDRYPGGSASKFKGLVGQDACKSGAKTVAHETHCDQYYECYGDQGFLQSCPNGLVYIDDGRFGLVGNCDYPHNENCDSRPERNPPQSTEHCDWLYGIFGHETSCTRYWTCWNGTATEQFCIGGLLYNEETHACDWPQNVAGCQKHPLCKDDANGNVPLGKSCNRYWACQGGYPRLQRCPAMLVFDKNRKRCVTPPTEDCEVPTTNAPTAEDGGDNGNSGPGSGGDFDGPSEPRNPNPRRGQQGARRNGGGGDGRRPQPIALEGPNGDPLPFNLPPGAVPLNN